MLADPRVPREPLDSLKYIPLSPYDPKTYLSFGGNLRERFEANNAANFGVGANHNQNYVISRSEAHADLRIADQVQVFVQLQSDFAPWKTILTPVDRDRLDLEQAFALLTEPIGDGTARIRLGRQQFNFDLQRFVSVRDGPNVRQSFDAAWADYEIGPWKFIALYSRPVQVLDDRAFDDYSSSSQTFSVARVQRKLSDTTTLSGYYAHFTQDNAKFVNATGDERREIFDVRFNGKLDISPPVVDLTAQGFTLLGGRLDYIDGKPIAAIVYKRRAHVVNLFVAQALASAPFAPRTKSVHGFNILRWSEQGLDLGSGGEVHQHAAPLVPFCQHREQHLHLLSTLLHIAQIVQDQHCVIG